MQFDVSDEAPFPRPLVFRTHRDAFETIAPRLEAVDRVRLKSESRHASGILEQTHEWWAKPSALPFFLRPIVPAEMLHWFGHTRWDPSAWICRWRIDVPALGPMAEIDGEQTYEEREPGCRITVRGRFDFHPERVEALTLPPGAVPFVERFVVGLIVPLMQTSSQAVIAHLHDEARRSS